MTTRLREVLAGEREANPLGWWYLSFADGTLPTGTQFLGAVVIRAHGLGDATQQAHRRGINPGGEVMGVAASADFEPPERYTNRLLSRAEVEEMDRVLGADPPASSTRGTP